MGQAFLVKNYHLGQFPWFGVIQNQLDHGLWNNSNFRLFLISESAGIFGNHFYQIALPWLVMEFTGSAGAMSAAIALSGISRIALMMVGGSLSDRFSPRVLILAAGILRAVLLVLLTGFVLTGHMSLGFLYAFSFASGLTDAIFLPARGAVMPQLVGRELLKAANSIATAQEKLWGLVGPAMAGLVITWVNRVPLAVSAAPTKIFLGPMAAFVINILAIVISMLFLRPIKFSGDSSNPMLIVETCPPAPVGSIITSFREVFGLMRNQASLRISFLMVYAINTISSGPLYIGMPMLAVSRFSDGAQALGFMTSAIGCGALLGTVLAGVLPQPKPHQLGRMFLVAVGGIGVGLVILFLVASVGFDALAILVLAAMISYINVTGVVQIQRDTPPAFLGRMMGLLNMK